MKKIALTLLGSALVITSLPFVSPASPLTAEETKPENLAEKLYRVNCSVCHGDKGDGNTMAAKGLAPRPPADFTDREYNRTLTLARIVDAITNGRPGTGMMPFKSQLSKKEIRTIATYIRDEFVKKSARKKK